MIGYQKSESGLVVEAPYNADFVSALKSSVSGCKWDKDARKWLVPVAGEETLKNLLAKFFGYRPGVAGVTMIIQAKHEIVAHCGSVYFHGIPVARATGRDSGARVCENVSLLEGKIASGGSVKNWQTIVRAGAKFRIDKVPEGLEGDDDWEVVEVVAGDKKAALLAEKAQLEKRLAEIDAALAAMEVIQ